MANRLATEQSPYLRQHADNPVDWYPWGKEALTRAHREDKPILLSVGYSACHWCHVMAHECFEDERIAGLMNAHFINIKVDREERPDLDQIYQNVAQLFTRGGGWPLTVFLTPDLRPFFGGTYFPPTPRYGRPGFDQVLNALSEAYRDKRADILENAEKVTASIARLESIDGALSPGSGEGWTRAGLKRAAESLVSHIDWENGGFGGAPKFPSAPTLQFVWRVGVRLGVKGAAEAVRLTLTRMAQGGIYDQLGGGFHRYSVDERWAVPHFEKMLYDNAQLLQLYAEVLLTQGAELSGEEKSLYRTVLAETVEYLAREMRAPDGSFYAAQDADSEGEEGKFFAWTPAQIREVLREGAEAEAALAHWGVTEGGNFEHGATVLYRATLRTPENQELIASVREKLFAARSRRIPPGRDDKRLVAWNALAISGLSWAGAALDHCGEGKSARLARDLAWGAWSAVCKNATRVRARQTRLIAVLGTELNGYLDDYVFMARAALDLARFSDPVAEVTRIDESIDFATRLMTTVLDQFADPQGTGFFFTSRDHESLIQRPQTLFDQAIPSGCAMAFGLLRVLDEMGALSQDVRAAWKKARADFQKLSQTAIQQAFGQGELLCSGLLEVLGPVVVSGAHPPARPDVFLKNGPLQYCHAGECHSGKFDATQPL